MDKVTSVTERIMGAIEPYLKPVQLQGRPHPRAETRTIVHDILTEEYGIKTAPPDQY